MSQNLSLKLFGLFIIFLSLPLASASRAADIEHWEATGIPATTITGNVTFMSGKIVFGNGTSLLIGAPIPLVNFKSEGQRVNALLFRVVTPSKIVLFNNTFLCSDNHKVISPTFLVIFRPVAGTDDEKPRGLAVFSSTSIPRLDSDRGTCGIFTYSAI